MGGAAAKLWYPPAFAGKMADPSVHLQTRLKRGLLAEFNSQRDALYQQQHAGADMEAAYITLRSAHVPYAIIQDPAPTQPSIAVSVAPQPGPPAPGSDVEEEEHTASLLAFAINLRHSETIGVTLWF